MLAWGRLKSVEALQIEDEGYGSRDEGLSHIILRAAAAVMTETTAKVSELIAEMRAFGWSPEELHFQHPTLSLGQIHSALAYYWDHQEALDRQIAQALEDADRQRTTA